MAERNGADATALWPTTGLSFNNLLDNPDLLDTLQNQGRCRLLLKIRDLYVSEIPVDTVWYRVDGFSEQHLSLLYVVNQPCWLDPGDRNELLKVAKRKPLTLSLAPSEWEAPIFFGHAEDGPFCILEGNHRLTAFSGSGQSSMRISVYIGISQQKCRWNPLDV